MMLEKILPGMQELLCLHVPKFSPQTVAALAGSKEDLPLCDYFDTRSVEQNTVEKAVVDEALSEYSLYCDLLYRDWRFPLCSFLGEYASCPWLAAMMWSESTLLATRQLSRHLSGKLKGLTYSQPDIFQRMVESLPEDFTLVHLALSHDGSLYLVKMHKDREPLIMPLAPKSKVESVKSMMDKIIEENTRTCNLGKTTKDAKAFWAARRAVDTDLKNIIPHVQDMLLGAAAPLLLPSITISRKGIALAKGLVAVSQSSNGAQLPLSFAKELVSLATKIERTEWVAVVERMCDILGISSRKEFIQDLYSKTKTSALNIGLGNNIPSYTFLIVCPDLTTFPWEVVPIFDGATHVARVPSVHTFFQALANNKRVPMAVNIQKAFYVLDPDNNLGETQKRITNYVSKFGWQGIVGKIPSTAETTVYVLAFTALRSATWVMAVVHDISADGSLARAQLMHVRLTTLGWGMDGKSSVYDYTVAQCPSVVGCLWTVTDGEIDRYFMALVDLCFSADANRTLTGTDDGDSRLRLLVEAMKKAKSKCKLPYLTGAAVISYGIPVVASE
uniref:separase n=1 Tax=Angiostrongylus cantonensis TaxID=6313 RepID=A0A158PC93_ANGCA